MAASNKTPTLQSQEPVHLRLMPEHFSSGLWLMPPNSEYPPKLTERYVREVYPEDYALSPELQDRLYQWQIDYERMRLDSDSPQALTRFSAEGLAIARSLKLELPGAIISYWDEYLWVMSPAGRRDCIYLV